MYRIKHFGKSIANKLMDNSLARWLQRIWNWSLNASIPATKGYLTLLTLLILGFGGWIGNQFRQEQHLLTAIAKAPDALEGYRELNIFHANHTKRRIALFEQLQQDYPDSPWSPIFLSYIHYYETLDKGESEENSIIYAKVAKPLAVEKDALNSLFDAFYRAGAFEKAEETAASWVEGYPDSAEAYYSQSQSQKALGRFDEAEGSLKTCVDKAVDDDDFPGFYCARELITGTRHITFTLQSERLLVQTLAAVDVSQSEVREALPYWDLPYAGRYVAWGLTEFGPRRFYLRAFGEGTAVDLDGNEMVVVEDGFEIAYDWFWWGVFPRDRIPVVNVDRLPLGAYAGDTTITVVGSEDAEIMAASHPYTRVDGDTVSWEVGDTEEWERPLVFAVGLPPFTRLQLSLKSNPWLNSTAVDWLHASSTILLLAILFKMRKKGTATSATEPGRLVYRLLHPRSLFSWSFDTLVVGLAGITVFYQIWLIAVNYPYQPTYTRGSYYSYVAILALLLLRLILHALHNAYKDDVNTVHLGAVLFASYLVPRLHTSYLFYAQFIISLLVYYLVMVNGRKWLSTFNWHQVRAITSKNRRQAIEQIIQMDELTALEKAAHDQKLALAKGSMKPSDYKESQAILAPIIAEGEKVTKSFKNQLGIPEDHSFKDLLFRLGPGKNPFFNSLLALAIGTIPYLLFIVLASFSGDLWEKYHGGTGLDSIMDFLFDILAVPWGPIYFVSFGFLFHLLWGKHGATKGLMFGLILTLLNALYTWLSAWNQVNAIELWGASLRILSAFMFVGVVMDWMSIGLSWRRIRQFYDSPALASVLTIVGTAAATVVAGFMTGTLSQLLNLALQGASAAVGLDIPAIGP